MQSLEIFSPVWILILCAVLFAAFIRGLAGFGFALILAPVLLLILNPAAVVVINLFLSLLSNIVVIVHSHARIDFKRILPIALSSLLGIPLGVWIISVVATSILKIFIGVVIICFAVLVAFGFRKTFASERIPSYTAGFFSGILSSSTSLGGPPVVLFMHGQNWPKEVIHPSLAGYFIVLGSCSLIALSLSGQVAVATLITAASLAPALLVGTFLGMIMFQRVNTPFFRGFSIAIVICAGLLGVTSGLGLFP
jgi:uncharacterized membrane protein YfcA